MPVSKSAIKAMKQTQKATVRNKTTKATYRSKIKAVKKAVIAGEKDLGKLTSAAFQAIDKATKSGVIHKNTGARRKSRLVAALNKAIEKPLELVSIKDATKAKTKPKAVTKSETAKSAPVKAKATTKKTTSK